MNAVSTSPTTGRSSAATTYTTTATVSGQRSHPRSIWRPAVLLPVVTKRATSPVARLRRNSRIVTVTSSSIAPADTSPCCDGTSLIQWS